MVIAVLKKRTGVGGRFVAFVPGVVFVESLIKTGLAVVLFGQLHDEQGAVGSGIGRGIAASNPHSRLRQDCVPVGNHIGNRWGVAVGIEGDAEIGDGVDLRKRIRIVDFVDKDHGPLRKTNSVVCPLGFEQDIDVFVVGRGIEIGRFAANCHLPGQIDAAAELVHDGDAGMLGHERCFNLLESGGKAAGMIDD